MMNDFIAEPEDRTTAAISPRIIRLKYSGELNFSASLASGVLMSAMIRVATQPAKNEPSAAIPRALPALPWRAIW